MLRQFASITLVISFIALSASGVMMITLDSFAFQLQMHPVHKVFGILMVLAGCLHLFLNFKPIANYLKNRKTLILGVSMSCLLLFLLVAGLNKPLNQASVEQVEQLMSQMASRK